MEPLVGFFLRVCACPGLIPRLPAAHSTQAGMQQAAGTLNGASPEAKKNTLFNPFHPSLFKTLDVFEAERCRMTA